jgi:hypothetical protein
MQYCVLALSHGFIKPENEVSLIQLWRGVDWKSLGSKHPTSRRILGHLDKINQSLHIPFSFFLLAVAPLHTIESFSEWSSSTNIMSLLSVYTSPPFYPFEAHPPRQPFRSCLLLSSSAAVSCESLSTFHLCLLEQRSEVLVAFKRAACSNVMTD